MPNPDPEPPSDPFVVQRRVEFSETDMAGILHFSNYYRYMEFAEAALFREIGWPLFDERGASAFGWPRVKAECRYRAPLRFGDTVRIGLGIEHLTDRSVTYRLRFHKLRTGPDPSSPLEKVALGFMTTCYARKDSISGPIESIHLPDELRKRLEPFLLTI